MTGGILAIITVAIVIVVIAMLGVRIVRPWERGVIETLGKYTSSVESGLRFIFPIVQTMDKVDMRETVQDVPPQEVITKDNVVVTVDAVVYLEIVDPFNYKYNIDNFWVAVTKLAQTNLRNVVGDMSLDESLVSRDTINSKLREVLDTATDRWGAKVTRVEIQRIDPPADVTQAMHQQMKAERSKRAQILDAEGSRESQILVADGKKEAAIRKAQGEAEAIRQVADAVKYEKRVKAEGEAAAIAQVYDAIHEGRPTQDLIAIKYLESLVQMADGQANKIFLPYEATGILGSLGAIGNLFEEKSNGTVNAPQHTDPKTLTD